MRKVGLWLTLVGGLLLAGCPKPYPNCESDENCKDHGEVCVQGMCQECATDANCKPGFVCDANKCVTKPECTEDVNCGEGQKCQAGKCVASGPPPGSCTTTEDCPSGQECKDGMCTAVSEVTCTYEAVHFDFNEFNLTEAARSALSQYAECMKKAGQHFTLEGHADERGTEEYNMQLSQKRAASVRKYLVDLGVAGGLLDTVGYGENRPTSSGHDETAWAENRRVEFKAR